MAKKRRIRNAVYHIENFLVFLAGVSASIFMAVVHIQNSYRDCLLPNYGYSIINIALMIFHVFAFACCFGYGFIIAYSVKSIFQRLNKILFSKNGRRTA